MEIRTGFKAEDTIPTEHTCQGEGTPPPIEFDEIPGEANSLVIICEDPDAPGGTFYHWGVYDIPADTGELNAEPSAADFPHAAHSAGQLGYFPPCPPEGDGPHRYRFHVFAIEEERLDFDGTPTVEQLLEEAESRAVARASVQGRFQR